MRGLDAQQLCFHILITILICVRQNLDFFDKMKGSSIGL